MQEKKEREREGGGNIWLLIRERKKWASSSCYVCSSPLVFEDVQTYGSSH